MKPGERPWRASSGLLPDVTLELEKRKGGKGSGALWRAPALLAVPTLSYGTMPFPFSQNHMMSPPPPSVTCWSIESPLTHGA